MRSFWNTHVGGCNEHYLLHLLRESEDYLPEFSRIVKIEKGKYFIEYWEAIFPSKIKDTFKGELVTFDINWNSDCLIRMVERIIND